VCHFDATVHAAVNDFGAVTPSGESQLSPPGTGCPADPSGRAFDAHRAQGRPGYLEFPVSPEADFTVLAARRDGDRLALRCHNAALDLGVMKTYELVDGGRGLAKRTEVGPLQRRGELRVRSVVRLDPAYRDGSFYYTPRQSWPSPPDRDLFGVQPASRFATEVVSGSGWDNRFVVAFKPGSPALGHYRWAIRDRHVMPSAVIGSWGQRSPTALTYTPDGWSHQLLHTLDGEREPVSATAHYLLVDGDHLDVWRHYRALPEHRAWEEEPVPEWVTKCGLGGFWHVSPGADEPQMRSAHESAGRRTDRYLPLGVFAWSLDGDYETQRPFINEPGRLIVTPEYFRAQVAAFQQDPRVRLGLYFQGALLERRTAALRDHPEWATRWWCRCSTSPRTSGCGSRSAWPRPACRRRCGHGWSIRSTPAPTRTWASDGQPVAR
jgi:hypothetical protein